MKLQTLVFLLSLTLHPVVVEAGLSLEINFLTEEIALVGSDTGTPGDLGGDGFVRWEFEDTFSPSTLFSDGSMFTSSASSPRESFDATFAADDDGYTSIWFGIYLSGTTTTTISGTGIFVPIHSHFPHAEESIRNLIGKEIPLDFGTGFQSLSIVAVPEPTTWALMSGLVVLGFVCWGRFRRSLNKPR